MSPPRTEAEARENIDAALVEAGWVVQDRLEDRARMCADKVGVEVQAVFVRDH